MRTKKLKFGALALFGLILVTKPVSATEMPQRTAALAMPGSGSTTESRSAVVLSGMVALLSAMLLLRRRGGDSHWR